MYGGELFADLGEAAGAQGKGEGMILQMHSNFCVACCRRMTLGGMYAWDGEYYLNPVSASVWQCSSRPMPLICAHLITVLKSTCVIPCTEDITVFTDIAVSSAVMPVYGISTCEAIGRSHVDFTIISPFLSPCSPKTIQSL